MAGKAPSIRFTVNLATVSCVKVVWARGRLRGSVQSRPHSVQMPGCRLVRLSALPDMVKPGKIPQGLRLERGTCRDKPSCSFPGQHGPRRFSTSPFCPPSNGILHLAQSQVRLGGQHGALPSALHTSLGPDTLRFLKAPTGLHKRRLCWQLRLLTCQAALQAPEMETVLLREAIGRLAQALAHLRTQGWPAASLHLLRGRHVEDNLTTLLLRDVRRR